MPYARGLCWAPQKHHTPTHMTAVAMALRTSSSSVTCAGVRPRQFTAAGLAPFRRRNVTASAWAFRDA